ncbi:phage GP46 family protein [Luteibacter yeojuensis]|uniref:phage GP46 family protein n=1 Tax=Luteibacter yeojuensis TaxID=345309 RepID=UPI000A076C1E|nr:phage GP46 family protein [Luteibacter yeojuensis]
MDHEIDPVTGDLTGRRITDLRNAVYLRLQVPRGSWFGDKDLGSHMHLLRRAKATPRTLKLAIHYANDALAPLLADGRAQLIEVDGSFSRKNRLALRIIVTEPSGATHNFNHDVIVA